MTTAQRPAWRRPRLRAPGAQGKSCVRATSKKTTCPPSLKGPVGACERHKTARARARSVATRACCAIVLAGHWPCWACASAGRGAGRRGTAGLGWGSSGATAREPDHHLLVTSIVPTPSPAGGCARSSTTDTITACLVRWASMGSRLLSVSSAHKPTVTSNSRFSARLRELPPGRRSARARNAERKNPRVSGHGSSGERPTPESAQPSIAARRRAPESLENPCVMSQKISTIFYENQPLLGSSAGPFGFQLVAVMARMSAISQSAKRCESSGIISGRLPTSDHE